MRAQGRGSDNRAIVQAKWTRREANARAIPGLRRREWIPRHTAHSSVTARLAQRGCNAHATLTHTAAGVVATLEVIAREALGVEASEVAVADVSEQNATRRSSLTSASHSLQGGTNGGQWRQANAPAADPIVQVSTRTARSAHILISDGFEHTLAGLRTTALVEAMIFRIRPSIVSSSDTWYPIYAVRALPSGLQPTDIES
jgi:hypothetical protein